MPWSQSLALPLLVVAVAACGSASTPPVATTLTGTSTASTDHRGVTQQLSWPPPESWIIPPSPAQPGGPAFVFPTPTPAPPPDGSHHPGGSPFSALSRGYDASFPQCSAGTKPASAAYGIVGINGGRAFTLNACFTDLLRAAPKGPAST